MIFEEEMMAKTSHYRSNQLHIEVQENADTILVKWTGKSTDREPGKFIVPILVNVMKKSSDKKRKIVLDFRELDYLNSSTITPIIKVLERAKKGTADINLLFKKNLKWQKVIFSALEIFQTKDGRIEIKGL